MGEKNTHMVGAARPASDWDRHELRIFGGVVREVRARRNVSQEVLGHRAGLHRNYVAAIERGERSTPRSASSSSSAAASVSPSRSCSNSMKIGATEPHDRLTPPLRCTRSGPLARKHPVRTCAPALRPGAVIRRRSCVELPRLAWLTLSTACPYLA